MNTRVLLLITTLGASMALGQMAVVNGASYDPMQPVAPGSFASVFGQNLCARTATGDWIAPGQLPASLGGCSVMVNGQAAMLQYVSPGQINFIMPQNMAIGQGSVMVIDGSQSQAGSLMVGPSGPGLFAFNGMGTGDGAMLHGTLWQQGPFSITTNGQATPISIFVTGLDLSMKPVVMVGGTAAEVTWFGNAPGYAGLQQININMPAAAAGAGRVPVTILSGGQTGNVVFMDVLPTTAMMQGIPGWSSGSMIGENRWRGHEMSSLAVNPANNTALVTDENNDAVRVISLDSKTTTATITLPAGSRAHAIAVNASGSLAAVVLSSKASIALIDLAQNKVVAVIGAGYYPSRLAFSGTNLLVTNQAGGTVSVIDTVARAITQTIAVGFGPSGIAANASLAVVANLQGGSLAAINLSNFTVKTISLPAGTRPWEVAISTAANKALISAPMTNSVLVLDLATNVVSPVDLSASNGMGPGAVAANGNFGFVANQMTASVTVVDLAAGKVLRTFPVDPGPRALAVNPAKNQLLVLSQGTGTLDVVDLTSYAIVARLNAGDTERQGQWILPLISSFTPSTAVVGTTFNWTINGSNLQSVKGLEFFVMRPGGSMMGGGMGPASAGEDANIKVSNVQVNAAGTQITAVVQVLAAATPGTRLIRLETDQGDVMGIAIANALFTVTK